VVGLTAYRIVQESLTNVIKHAGAHRADVALTFDDRALIVTVDDDGSTRPDGEATGQGLVGMRERVAMLGGSLEAGPRAIGGFSVRARLPLDA
jgi:signal transduction histidine kinase